MCIDGVNDDDDDDGDDETRHKIGAASGVLVLEERSDLVYVSMW